MAAWSPPWPIPVIAEGDFEAMTTMLFPQPVVRQRYIAELELRCRTAMAQGYRPVAVVVTEDDYVSWCAANGISAGHPASLESYAAARVAAGMGIATSGDIEGVLEAFSRWQSVMAEVREAFPDADAELGSWLAWANSLASALVEVALRELPWGGAIRVVTYRSDVDDVFAVESDPSGRGLRDEWVAQIHSCIVLTLFKGGWMLVECAEAGRWRYFVWGLSTQGCDPLPPVEAARLVGGSEGLDLDDLNVSAAIDAPFVG